MTKLEKFNVFITERIILSKTKATESAYRIVKTQVNKLFSETDLYDAILDIDLDSDNFTGTFVGEKRAEDVFDLIETITEAANVEHRAKCDNKSDRCPGVMSYLIPHLKIHLTAHPEYDASTVFAIIASIFVEIGRRDMEAKILDRSKSRNEVEGLIKLLKKLSNRDDVEINVIKAKDKD